MHVVCQIALITTITSGSTARTRIARTGYAAPISFAASRSVLTSASGFFWLALEHCLVRLTQITGTFFFRHGSTSW